MSDFMTPERRIRLLAAWERCVVEEPEVARQAGPPSWLVMESWEGEKVEPFTTAVERVKARYLSPSDVPTKRNVPTQMSPVVPSMSPAEVDVATLSGDICRNCGKRDVERGRKECSACRKARQRKT